MSNIGDKFRWVVYTHDGGSVAQVAASGQKNSYEDLPLDNIKSFELWDWARNERVLLVVFKLGEKLVWRRRNQAEPGGSLVETCHIVGKISRDGTKGVIGVFESDGHIEAASEFLPNSEWFYPPASEVGEQSGVSQMAIEKYRAFYTPTGDKEQFVDARELNQLPTGAIFVISLNEDGTREVVSQKQKLTPKDQKFYDYAQRHLEFKHDGGDTPAMYEERKSRTS